MKFRNAEWTVTGTFTTKGDIHDSELLADTDTVSSSLERTGYSSVLALLKSPAEFQTFKDALTSNPQLSVDFGIKQVQGMRLSYSSSSVNLHKEYESYARKINKDGETVGIEDPKCLNHLMSAIRYALTMFAGSM